jgi:hypothetical protein
MSAGTDQGIVVARLTMTREDDTRLIVEVRSDATFHRFYAFFTQQGKKRSTKTFTRWGSRNEALPVVNTHLYIPGLEVLALRFRHHKFGSPIKSTRLTFYSKRTYKKLILMAPDQLGLSTVRVLLDQKPIRLQLRREPSYRLVGRKNYFKIHAGAMS